VSISRLSLAITCDWLVGWNWPPLRFLTPLTECPFMASFDRFSCATQHGNFDSSLPIAQSLIARQKFRQ
jgi:hypothetical protein